MSFEHCQTCKPPTRYPGCHSKCPHYQEDLAKTKKRRQRRTPRITQATIF